QIEKIARGIVEAWGATCDVDFIRGYPANVNDAKLIDLAKKTVDELGYEIVVPPQNLGAEDFAYYALEKPCVYIHVGGANPADPRTYSPHHSKGFMLDEDMLDIALECELAFYLKATGQA
ncbi:MAG: M20/M25/M40 family metallo-hydrolase, partial [Solobacterium sp.]|nr:M20/M25/M40 family metallo-hydrolase [Solobacterium sp.]